VAAVALLILGTHRVATAQVLHYQPGVSNIRDFFLATPGFAYAQYNTYYASNTLKDPNGVTVDADTIAGFVADETRVFTIAPELSWNPGLELLGLAYTFVVSPSFANSHVGAHREGGGELEQDQFGNGDLMVQPLWIGGGWKHTYLSGGYAFYAPIGKYTPNAPDNIGLGFWSHQLQFGGYYLPNANEGTVVMLMTTYEFAGEQEGTDITPGDHLSLEWGLGQKLGTRWRLGGSGYLQWQVTGATGVPDPDARDRVYAAGGQVAFWPIIERFYLSGRLLAEFGARDRFQGLLGTFSLAYTF